jgi:hypothetical protein
MWYYTKTTSGPDNNKTNNEQHISYEDNINSHDYEDEIEVQSSRNFMVVIVAIVMLACTIVAVVSVNALVEIMDRKVEIQRLQTLEACYNSDQIHCGDNK